MVLAEPSPVAPSAGEFVGDPVDTLALLAAVHHVLAAATAHQLPTVWLLGIPAGLAEANQ